MKDYFVFVVQGKWKLFCPQDGTQESVTSLDLQVPVEAVHDFKKHFRRYYPGMSPPQALAIFSHSIKASGELSIATDHAVIRQGTGTKPPLSRSVPLV